MAVAAVHRGVETALALAALGWERLTIIVAAMGSLTYLAANDKIDPSAVVALITLTIGYGFGRSAPEPPGTKE